MADGEDLPSSDSSDDDYVPECESADEEVSDIEEKDPNSGDSDAGENHRQGFKKAKKRKRLPQDKSVPRKRTGGIKLEDELENNENSGSEPNDLTNDDCKDNVEEHDGKKADSLWADFKKDVDMKTKCHSPEKQTLMPIATHDRKPPQTKQEKIVVTKIFDFAGEEVRVTTEVDANSKEAKQAGNPKCTPVLQSDSSSASSVKKQAGLSSVLSKLGAKKKLSTLDKSLLDWKEFKQKEGIEEELKTFNKGKDGYTEKLAFLQRADLRQFEVEKNLRFSNRSNR